MSEEILDGIKTGDQDQAKLMADEAQEQDEEDDDEEDYADEEDEEEEEEEDEDEEENNEDSGSESPHFSGLEDDSSNEVGILLLNFLCVNSCCCLNPLLSFGAFASACSLLLGFLLYIVKYGEVL